MAGLPTLIDPRNGDSYSLQGRGNQLDASLDAYQRAQAQPQGIAGAQQQQIQPPAPPQPVAQKPPEPSTLDMLLKLQQEKDKAINGNNPANGTPAQIIGSGYQVGAATGHPIWGAVAGLALGALQQYIHKKYSQREVSTQMAKSNSYNLPNYGEGVSAGYPQGGVGLPTLAAGMGTPSYQEQPQRQADTYNFSQGE